MTRWGLDAEEGLVPLSLLNCVNRMFMVARSTSERLCLICAERNATLGRSHRGHRRPAPAAHPQLPGGGEVGGYSPTEWATALRCHV